MINCKYCGYGNPETAGECGKCGAPRGHAFPLSSISKALNVWRELSSQTSDAEWPVRGYDASAWQANQEGATTKKKAQFGYIRAGYGNKSFDPCADRFIQESIDHSIEYGLYWFLKIGLDWQKHAVAFYNFWKTAPGKLLPVVDCEQTTLGKQQTTDWIYKVIREFENLSGKEVMIYTSPGWWNSCTVRSDWPKQHPLWVAHFTKAASPIVPHDWGAINNPVPWTFWQHSADGNNKAAEYGFSGGEDDLDLDRFNGTVADFNRLYGTNIQPLLDEEPLPPIEEVDPIYIAQVTSSSLNVRGLPTTASPILGGVKLGDRLPVIEEYGEWCHIDGWISKNYVTKL